MAKAGVETAWWDLCAARERTTLATLVGRRLEELAVEPEWRKRRDRIDCGVALGIPPGEDKAVLRTWIQQALQRGYRRIKLKVRPGWDVEPVRMAHEEMRKAGRTIPLWVDANGAYQLERDHQALQQIDSLGLLFIEQPLPDDALWDSCALARLLQTSICFDESLISDDVARQIVEMNGPRIWNVKIQRVGGLEEACRIYARATQSSVALWGGTMPETGIGAQAMLALCAYAGFVYPSDIEPSERWYEAGTDLIELEMSDDGTMLVPGRRPALELDARAMLVAEIG
jgi:O-succinylbenzoate synthase